MAYPHPLDILCVLHKMYIFLYVLTMRNEMEKKAASRMIFVFCVHESVFIVVVCVIKSKKFEIQRHFFKANENVFYNCATFGVCDFGCGFCNSIFLHQSKTTNQPESFFVCCSSI